MVMFVCKSIWSSYWHIRIDSIQNPQDLLLEKYISRDALPEPQHATLRIVPSVFINYRGALSEPATAPCK
jgi:hypothetical protein